MKAYIDDSNEIRMFRPDMNMKRINSSAHRLLLPQINGPEFLKCIEQLLVVEKDWIPKGFGYSLYLRPTLIATWVSEVINSLEDENVYSCKKKCVQ